mmetsp:Transcript_41189/g.34694  ORF Transcript_41189/g.34694 Transcript_41189/m.34694 type:complete len:84 (-) Transcript_41189:2104-2355(-)
MAKDTASKYDSLPAADYVAELFDMTGAIEKTISLSKAQYIEVSDKIIEAYEVVPEFKVGEDKSNRRGRFVACLLRTAGHDFMD